MGGLRREPQYHGAGHWLGTAAGQIHNTSGQGIQMKGATYSAILILFQIKGNTWKTET